MTRDSNGPESRLSRLSRNEQRHFLVSLAHAITVSARGLYENDAPEGERIRAFIGNVLEIAGERYRAALEWAIERAFEATERQQVAG